MKLSSIRRHFSSKIYRLLIKISQAITGAVATLCGANAKDGDNASI